MNAHVNLVVVLVNDAYHLLVGVAGGNAHQSGKLSDSEIHVYDEVAGMQFLQLFHRECHLSAARGIRPQIVFMEAVEYLVVSEDADTQFAVGKSPVECFLHRHECYRFACHLRAVGEFFVSRHLVKDVAQTLVLLLAVGKDI